MAIVRGGFEYQGQKCSAASRVYVPQSLWPEVRDRVVAMMREMKMGDVADFRTFMGAVIDRKSFDKISGYLDDARKNATHHSGWRRQRRGRVLHRADAGRDEGPGYRLMCEEIFGPVRDGLRVSGCAVGGDAARSIDRTSPYALTGAVFARDRAAVRAGVARAAQRRRQLLHQRQADRRGRRAAAVRRRPRVGHQRQGRLEDEPAAVGERADDQGDVLAAARLPIPLHVRRVRSRSRVARRLSLRVVIESRRARCRRRACRAGRRLRPCRRGSREPRSACARLRPSAARLRSSP